MRIAQLAPLIESVPPRGYGGTESVIGMLTDELVDRGHSVTLFAAGDSSTRAELVAVVPRSLRVSTDIPVRRWQAYDLQALLELERRQDEFDVVHNHMGYQALPFLRASRVKSVTTNHNPVKDYCQPVYFACGQLNYVAISKAYRHLNYPDKLNYVAMIYNGIDLQNYSFDSHERGKYLLFVGRICKDKGTREAIDIALRLGMPLKIAAKIDSADSEYYEHEIKPHLGKCEIEYVGEVGSTEKVDLYKHSLAVVYPVAFDEPFGLVMVESLATGTPVMALNRGAVTEVLSDGETAVIADSVDGLVERFSEIERISPQACRQRAERLFSKQRMADEYEELYHKICN